MTRLHFKHRTDGHQSAPNKAFTLKNGLEREIEMYNVNIKKIVYSRGLLITRFFAKVFKQRFIK